MKMARIEYDDDTTRISIELDESVDGVIEHDRDTLELKFREMLTGLGFRYPQEAYEYPEYIICEDCMLQMESGE